MKFEPGARVIWQPPVRLSAGVVERSEDMGDGAEHYAVKLDDAKSYATFGPVILRGTELRLAASTPDAEAQRARFHGTTGAFGYTTAAGRTGANHHPDRCVCQGKDTTPHKHYDELPFSCARCLECKGYTPAVPRAREVVVADAAHPIWKSWDDDDWNGKTCDSWLYMVAWQIVCLTPPPDGCAPDLLGRIVQALLRSGVEVRIGVRP